MLVMVHRNQGFMTNYVFNMKNQIQKSKNSKIKLDSLKIDKIEPSFA